METNHMYKTAIEAIQCLRKEGYTADLKVYENGIFYKDSQFRADEFEITHTFRFENNTDPIDDAVVYGIKSNTNNKGILIITNAVYFGPISQTLMNKLEIREYDLLRA